MEDFRLHVPKGEIAAMIRFELHINLQQIRFDSIQFNLFHMFREMLSEMGCFATVAAVPNCGLYCGW